MRNTVKSLNSYPASWSCSANAFCDICFSARNSFTRCPIRFLELFKEYVEANEMSLSDFPVDEDLDIVELNKYFEDNLKNRVIEFINGDSKKFNGVFKEFLKKIAIDNTPEEITRYIITEISYEFYPNNKYDRPEYHLHEGVVCEEGEWIDPHIKGIYKTEEEARKAYKYK